MARGYICHFLRLPKRLILFVDTRNVYAMRLDTEIQIYTYAHIFVYTVILFVATCYVSPDRDRRFCRHAFLDIIQLGRVLFRSVHFVCLYVCVWKMYKISQSCSGSIEVTRVNIWVPGFLPACLVSHKTMKILVSFSSQGPQANLLSPKIFQGSQHVSTVRVERDVCWMLRHANPDYC